MQFPKSLREVRTAVRSSGSGGAFAVISRVASRWQQTQGTKSFPQQGTSSAGNTPDPLNPGKSITPDRPIGWDAQTWAPTEAIFSTDKLVEEGAQGTVSQVKDWPPNPSEQSLSPSSGHREQVGTDGALHMGEGPGRIERLMPWRVFGVVTAATGHHGSEAGYDNDMASRDYLQHHPVARQALGVKGPQKLSDDNAPIPAIYAGNPRA